MAQTEFWRRALLWGSGSSADRIVGVLQTAGISVTVVTTGAHPEGGTGEIEAEPPGAAAAVTHIPGGRILRIDGHVGQFRILVEDGKRTARHVEAGFILVDGPSAHSQDTGRSVRVPAEHLLTLTELEALAASPGPAGLPGAIAIWLDPREGIPDRVLATRAFRAARQLAGKGVHPVYVLHRHVPLYGLDGQEMYDDLRKAGVRFFRLDAEPPACEFLAGRIELTVPDRTTTGLPAKLTVDRILPIGQPAPLPMSQEIARLVREPVDPEGFLQKDNAHLYPSKAFRRGIYYVGACRGEVAEEEFSEEIMAILSELAEPLRSGVLEAPEGITIEKGHCISCLTCYRACPHYALDISQGPVPVPVHAACFGCGLCEALCPGRAIRLVSQPGFQALGPPAEIPGGRADRASPTWLEKAPGSLVFACSRSGGLAAEATESLGLSLPTGFTLLKIPCACSLSEEMLLDAFLNGVQKVLVLGCHEDNCVSQKGTAAGRRRLRRVTEYLEASGRHVSTCLQFASLASNESHRLARILDVLGDQSPNSTNGNARLLPRGVPE